MLASAGAVSDRDGGAAVQDEARIRHDITWTVTIAMVAIIALFSIVLRRIGLLLILLVPLTLSTLWTLGVTSFYPGHLNIVTVAFAAILLGMGDDSLTHLYLRFHEELGAGRARAEALKAAASSTGPSILLATLTSGLAFGALAFVEFRGLSELGVIAAMIANNTRLTARADTGPNEVTMDEGAKAGSVCHHGTCAVPMTEPRMKASSVTTMRVLPPPTV